MHLHMSPTDYWNLTRMEREAIIDAHNEANKKR